MSPDQFRDSNTGLILGAMKENGRYWLSSPDGITIALVEKDRNGWLLDVSVADADAMPLTHAQITAIAALLQWLNANS